MAESGKQTLGTRLRSQLVGKVVYPLWTKRDHPAYLRYRKRFEKSQWYSADQLRVLQLRLLREQLALAYANIPYYRRVMDEASLDPRDLESLDDFRHFPVLTKRDIQENKTEMLSTAVAESKRELNYTGGSTGSPLQFWVDKERFDSRRASTDRHDAWAGLKPGEWFAHLWGARADIGNQAVPDLGWRQKWLHRSITMNTGLCSEAALRKFVALVRKYRPRFLKAYAQAADMFAVYCRDRKLDDIRFDAVIATAEVLLPEARARIEQVLGPVFNRYGCREVSIIASECDQHSGMHVNADALLVEVEPVAGTAEGMGRVLVTDLYNRSMPLLRYEIGDYAQWSADKTPCSCGRALPRLAQVEGRITDFLRCPDGTLISGPTLTLPIAQIAEIRQAQFVQTGPDRVCLRVVPRGAFGQDTQAELRRRLEPYFTDQLKLEIMLVEVIPAEASGKYRFVKQDFARKGEARG